MNSTLVRAGLVALLVGAVAGCGGGGGGGEAAPAPTPTPPPPAPPTISSLATDPANDVTVNPGASFTAVQSAGLTVVTVASPPVVNFTVIADGEVKKGLTTADVSLAIAKLVRGTNGDPDQWVSYVYRTRTGAGGTFTQATTDRATSTGQLVYNEAGYYTYTFSADIKNKDWESSTTKDTNWRAVNGVTFDASATHRIAFQLRYTNKAGETVNVSPTFDFTLDSSGKSVAVTDATKTLKVVDVASCNTCHNKLTLHGRRVDTQYCVMCHNSGSTDHTTGNPVEFRTMVHKIHAGRYLHHYGENYQVSDHKYDEVGFPANVRNCVKCHDNTKAANADNWKSKPSKQACLTCHQSKAGSDWYNVHITTLGLGASADAVANASCASCHGAGTAWAPDKAHWLQELENTKLYEGKILSVTLNTAPTDSVNGKVTVKYAVVNPANGKGYNLREGCAGSTAYSTAQAKLVFTATAKEDITGADITACNSNYRWYTSVIPGAPQDKFGVFSVYLATDTSGAAADDTTDSTSKAAYLGKQTVVDGDYSYEVELTVPKGAKGNARVMMVGSVAEARLDPFSRAVAGAVPPTTHEDLAYVPVKNTISELNILTGSTSSARRKIVSNDKCNACHAYLGIPMNPEFGAHAFHSGLRNNSEGCEVCHNWARAGSYTAMADGTSPAFSESWQLRRFAHALHARDKRTYAFTHGNDQIGPFAPDGSPLAGATTTLGNVLGGTTEVLNLTAEVIYPGRLADCNTCHVNDSWKQNRAVFGSAIVSTSTSKNAAGTGYTNPAIGRLEALGICTGTVAGGNLSCTGADLKKIPVISPKASVCLACHDSDGVRTHAISVGGAIFGGLGGTAASTHGDILAGKVFESCDGCHAPGGFVGIDARHGLK